MKPRVSVQSIPVLVLLLQIDLRLCAAKAKRGDSQPKSSRFYHYSNYGNYGGSDSAPAAQDPAINANPNSDSPYAKDYSQNYANYGFDYNANAGGEQTYDYVDDKSEPLQCYSCHYHVQYGHTMGTEACNDPFDGSVIPDVICEGPCGKVYRKLDNIGEFMIVRNCMQSCKEVQDTEGYTQCCSTSLCNSATRPLLTACSYWTTLVTCALTVLIFQRR